MRGEERREEERRGEERRLFVVVDDAARACTCGGRRRVSQRAAGMCVKTYAGARRRCRAAAAAPARARCKGSITSYAAHMSLASCATPRSASQVQLLRDDDGALPPSLDAPAARRRRALLAGDATAPPPRLLYTPGRDMGVLADYNPHYKVQGSDKAAAAASDVAHRGRIDLAKDRSLRPTQRIGLSGRPRRGTVPIGSGSSISI